MIHTTLLKPWVTSEKKLTTFQTDLFISTDLFVFSQVKHRDNFILHQKSLQVLFWAPATFQYIKCQLFMVISTQHTHKENNENVFSQASISITRNHHK